MENEGIDILQLIAERKIAEAIERGEFENLALKGQPLDLTTDPMEPAERRLAHRILNNAGMAPLEISLQRELDQLRRELSRTTHPEERERLAREIRFMILRLNVMRRCALHGER